MWNIDQNNVKNGSINYNTVVSPVYQTANPSGTLRSTVQAFSGASFQNVEGGSVSSASFARVSQWTPANVSIEFQVAVTAPYLFFMQAQATRASAHSQQTRIDGGLFVNGSLCEETVVSVSNRIDSNPAHIPISYEGSMLLAPGTYTVIPNFRAVIDDKNFPDITDVSVGALGLVR